jgi:hypothetical protein
VESGFNSDFIVSTSGALRGSVDIERDLPVSTQVNSDAVGIIITQELYPDSISSVRNAHRSGDLVNDYFVQTLGIPEQNVIRLKSPFFAASLTEVLNDETGNAVLDFRSRDLFFYFAGAGETTIDSSGVSFNLLSSMGKDAIDLESLFVRISTLNTNSNVIILETDFSNQASLYPNETLADSLNFIIDQFLMTTKNSAVLFASELNQRASNYQSIDLRTDRIHGIFTYYFLQALQSGESSLPQIRDVLLRNVTFTSRRLHNRAQDPLIKFNSNFLLKPQE